MFDFVVLPIGLIMCSSF